MPENENYSGEIRILQRLNDYEFAFEADILRDGPVQGGRWVFENLDEYYKTFAGRPVLVAYIGNRVGDGHNFTTRRDPKTGEEYRSFLDPTAERIVGTISEELSDLTLVEGDNGYTWLRVKGRIFTEYARELVDTIVRTGRMSVSIEANVYDIREENGIEYYDRWVALGLTILHPDVAPAVPGANIRALADMEEEFESMKLRVASLVKESESREEKPQNKSTTKELRNSMNLTKQQLKELQERFGSEYRVLSAVRKEDGDTTVMLMRRSDCAFLSYSMSDKDTGVYAEKFVNRVASISLNAAEGEEELCAEAGEVICDELAEAEAEKESLCSENKRLSAELETAKSQLAAMQEFETRRRTAAAKDHAKSVLNGYNENRAEKVSETVIASVIEDAGNGAYNTIMNADGNWIGLSAVEKDVKALCADEQMKLDAKHAKDGKTQFVWERFASESPEDDGSPAALIASL